MLYSIIVYSVCFNTIQIAIINIDKDIKNGGGRTWKELILESIKIYSFLPDQNHDSRPGKGAKYNPGQKSRLDKMVCNDGKYAWKSSERWVKQWWRNIGGPRDQSAVFIPGTVAYIRGKIKISNKNTACTLIITF